MTIATMCRRYMTNAFMKKAFRSKLQILVLTAGIVILLFFKSHKEVYTGSKNKFYIMVFGERKLDEPSQRDISNFAKHVRIKYTVEDNLITGDAFGTPGYYLLSISLFNTGNKPIPAKRWEMYGYIFRTVEHKSFPYPNGFYIHSCGLKIYHVNGMLYKFIPSGVYYTEIKPGDYITCILKVHGFQVGRTDSMPNWYVTGRDLVPQIITNTQQESLKYVSDFKSERQYKRRKDDPYSPLSAPERYAMYETETVKGVEAHPVIPTPLEIKIDKDKNIEWNTQVWRIVRNTYFDEEIKYLADETGLKIVQASPVRKGVKFVKAPVLVEMNGKQIDHPEAYILVAEPGKDIVTITASSNTGAFYAIQTLLSLVFTPFIPEGKAAQVNVPAFSVKDVPRYSYRGLHIDVARNFHDKEQVKKTIDAMAAYKMNKLHLHLSDDEGWRLEIPGLPELTHIGSRRCHDPDEEQCIMPALGSGPYDNTTGTGFFSVGDYTDILKYAKSHHIEVIPEFDMPGHSRAAIRSIHAKSQQSHRSKMNKAEIYRIIDEEDKSDYKSGQGYRGDVINPCMESTYIFVKKIINEVKKLHADIQPLKFYHFGGDEVALDAWKESGKCKEFMNTHPGISTQHDLMRYFINSVARLASEAGMSIGAWEDAVLDETPYSRSDFQNKDIYVYVWKRLVQNETPHRTVLLANNNYKVVLAYGSYLYFDHPYEADPEERGLYWATRKISTYDVWGFHQNMIDKDRDLPCPDSVPDRSDCYELKKPENIVGIQAEIWTETVRTDEQMDYMLFPRLLAVAERAWHQASWEDETSPTHITEKRSDWIGFRAALGNRELLRLDKMGIQYRVPPPGAKVKNGKLLVNTAYPGEDVEVFNSVDQTWSVASFNMPVTHAIKLRTRSADGSRYSRVITVYPTDTGKSECSTCSANRIFILFTVSLNACLVVMSHR